MTTSTNADTIRETERQNEDEASTLADHATADISLVDIDHDVAVMLELADGDPYWRR